MASVEKSKIIVGLPDFHNLDDSGNQSQLVLLVLDKSSLTILILLTMRTILKIAIAGLFIVCTSAIAQETQKNDKFSFHAFSIVPIGGEMGYNYTEAGTAASFAADISFSYKKNIFALSGAYATAIYWTGTSFNSTQVNLLYGREFELLEWLSIDPYAGIGLIRFSHGHENDRDLGIPILAKIRFKTGKIFSLGFKLQTNINSIQNLYSLGLVLQWNLKSSQNN